ncbi:MAG: DNA polymerase III subunit alpha [Parcubacteria group bacterium]|nr:DNA polymerase III subunit alpha [Parcubacteria group bacterium]
MLDGMSQIDEMVARAREFGMPALGLTDHGVLYGAIEFYKKCKKNGVKPIIGVEAYVAHGAHTDKRAGIDNKRYHLTLLAKNETGYRNLLQLVSIAHLKGFYYKPRIDKDLLRSHGDGLICLSGCMASELGQALRMKQFERAEEIIREHREIFGADNYFLEIMHHPNVPEYPVLREAVASLGRKLGVPLVATHDSHYLNRDDMRAHDTLLAVQQGTDLDDARRLSLSGDDFSFIDSATVYEYFKDAPDAVENTLRIAERCNIELNLGNWVFPYFRVPEGATHDSELRRLAYEGLPFRHLSRTGEVERRVEYELGIIQQKQFSPYFLVVGDLLRFARAHDILTNTRGSAAGSLVSYLLGITNVNPLELKLPFERFLNPERPSAPDIDMDFADNRRDEVIAYARQKYGEDRVAQIGTFGTMMARGAVRDVARALGHPYNVGDRISKLIPFGSQGFPMTIEHALELVAELSDVYKKDETARDILDLARRLEGTVRHVSVHAAGVVIAPTAVTDYSPVQFDPSGERTITQYDMYAVEDVGLLKFDFLGIKNLTILSNAVTLVKNHRETQVDLEHLPPNDETTYRMLARGETHGLFQLNGAGMTRYLKELRPTVIEDINAMIALYRPGPMAFIPDYIKRKENPELVRYLDDRLKTILEPTYGILVYQDDILLIVTQLAGYSWGEADKFRKAVGKKIPAEMQAQKEKFIKGCIENRLSEEKTQQLWNMIETFAAYGFNKSHAASYGQVAYQTAYLKAHFPTEYMAAVLTADAGDVEKIAETIAECARMGIPVLPPTVNESFGDFTVVKRARGENAEGDKIRFGLYSIKNFGNELADAIIRERGARGLFADIADFLERITHRNLNRKSLESLIKAGALDECAPRGDMLANIEEMLAYNREHARADEAQNSLFGLMADRSSVPALRLRAVPPLSQEQKLSWEKELLGLYVSGNPLEKHRARLESLRINIEKTKTYRDGITALVGGIVREAKIILTKQGDQMAFLKVADFKDTIEAVVFPRTFREHRDKLAADACILIKGRVSRRNNAPSIIAESVTLL